MIRRHAWVTFLAVALLATLFGVFPGGWFDPEADRDATLLTTTYALVAVVLTVAITTTAFRRGETWAWWALWVWPVFFLIHGIAFFVVDLVFAAIVAFVLLVARPSGRAPSSR